MILDDHPKLNLSYIHGNSQYDWSCDSESTNDSNLENRAENSGVLDEIFSSLLSSISRFQPPSYLKSIHLHHNSPDSTLSVNNAKLQVDKDTISSAFNNCML